MTTETNNQSNIKKSSRGGKREGAGRPKGSTNKVSTTEIVSSFYKLTGKNFAEYGQEWMEELKRAGKEEQALKIYAMLHKYHIDDSPQKIDVTSNGETIQTTFNFTPKDLNEWQDGE